MVGDVVDNSHCIVEDQLEGVEDVLELSPHANHESDVKLLTPVDNQVKLFLNTSFLITKARKCMLP